MASLLLHGSTASGIVSYALSTTGKGRNSLAHLPSKMCSMDGSAPHRSLSATMYHQPLLLFDGSTLKMIRCSQLLQLKD